MKNFGIYCIYVCFFMFSNVVKSQFLVESFNDRQLSVHIRGIHQAKIILTPIHTRNMPPMEKTGVKNNQKVPFVIPQEVVPGKFKMRIEYRQQPQEQMVFAETVIIINNEDVEFFVNPSFINNPDSSYFHVGEKENTVYAKLSDFIKSEREQIELLELLLINYDNQKSLFFSQAIQEYTQRRKDYNAWLQKKQQEHKALYISHFLQFEYAPEISWEGTHKEKLKVKLTNYFDGINFQDTLLLDLPEFSQMMSKYMGSWGGLIETDEDMALVYTEAGRIAIEKASKGHPKVYGWMVDYFFVGYESYNIQSGLKMLEKYIQDPNCLTSKRREILRRIEGIKTLQAGVLAPNFEIIDDKGKLFDFHKYKTNSPYKLIVFWSADCPHCDGIIKSLSEWHSKDNNSTKLDIIAISLDETETEIERWKKKKENLLNWKHMHANGGVNSKVAIDYYILSTPVVFIVDAKSNKIIDMPTSIDEIKKIIGG
jgi:thiol-disulfide isomerase/thioredoxin